MRAARIFKGFSDKPKTTSASTISITITPKHRMFQIGNTPLDPRRANFGVKETLITTVSSHGLALSVVNLSRTAHPGREKPPADGIDAKYRLKIKLKYREQLHKYQEACTNIAIWKQ
ncbi:MAG: hypothetical protein KGH84_05455 [Paracoccaceae bacterium]|nr:hypothetical protein [Paracoccaceae bacterium]